MNKSTLISVIIPIFNLIIRMLLLLRSLMLAVTAPKFQPMHTKPILTTLLLLLAVAVIARKTDKDDRRIFILKSAASSVLISKMLVQTPCRSINYTDAKLFDVSDYGALGDGINDDTQEFQAAINACRAANGKLIIPAPSNFYKITSTLNIIPSNGQNEVHIDIEGQGNPSYQILYHGPSNTDVFFIKGLRFSTISGIKIKIQGTQSGVHCFNLDTDNPSFSTAQIKFDNCHAALGVGQNNIGWTLGHISGGGADISNIMWNNCTVFGKYGVRGGAPGQIAWLIEGANTLQNVWNGCFAAFCDRMFSNVSLPGAGQTPGNGAVYFFGCGASQNRIDYEISNSSTYLISGGRYESGIHFMHVTNANDAPTITVSTVSIDDYSGLDTSPYSNGSLFFIDRPGSLTLQNISITRGKHVTYTSDMIKCYGGGEGSGKGTLIVEGGSIEASDPFYSVNNNKTEWSVYVRGVGKLMNGVRAQKMTDIPFISAPNIGSSNNISLYPLLVAQRNSQTSQMVSGFQNISLPTVVIDNKNSWNSTDSKYTIPETGTYKILMKYRLADNSDLNMSYGIGAGTSAVQDASFIWGHIYAYGGENYRHGIMNEKIQHYSAGDRITLYSYIDSEGAVIISAEMSIERIR